MDLSLDCDELVLWHVKSSRLLPAKKRLLSTQICSIMHLCIFKNVFEKAKEISEAGSVL